MSDRHKTGTSGGAPQVNPALALTVGVLAVSTGAIFARLADAPALVIAAYRVGLAGLVLVPVAAWSARGEWKRLSARDFGLALLAGVFLALHFATWIASLDYTPVANSVVLVNTNPLWVGLLAPVIARERVNRSVKAAIGLSVTGGILIGAGDFATGGGMLRGDLLALAGSVCMAVYLLLGRTLRRQLSLLAYVGLCYGSAAAVLWLMVLGSGLPFTGFGPATVRAFWAMALVPQLIGHTTTNWALRFFNPGFLAVVLLGEPVLATLMAYWIFGETLTWLKTAGGTFILAGIYLAASGKLDR